MKELLDTVVIGGGQAGSERVFLFYNYRLCSNLSKAQYLTDNQS